MISSVIFDLDGTLLDTTEGVLESVKYTILKMGYQQLENNQLLKFVGPPIQDSFKNFYNCTVNESQRAAEIFRDYYKSAALYKAVCYPNILDICQQLQDINIKMAVATYKREDYAIALLRHFGFDRFCTSMHGADNKNELKKQDIVNLCIQELNCSRDEIVLVGDTSHDAIGALKAKIQFIGVTYGFGFKTPDDVDAYPNIGVARSTTDITRIIMTKEDLT